MKKIIIEKFVCEFCNYSSLEDHDYCPSCGYNEIGVMNPDRVKIYSSNKPAPQKYFSEELLKKEISKTNTEDSFVKKGTVSWIK